MDLQGSCSPEDAIVQLSMATKEFHPLWSKTIEVFDNVLKKVAEKVESIGTDVIQAKLRDGVAGDWQAKGERLFEFLASSETEVIIFIDELPILVNRLLKGEDYTITPERRRVVEGFMSWIRMISIAHKGKIGLVVSGSIGLDLLTEAAVTGRITPMAATVLSAEYKFHGPDAHASLGNILDILVHDGYLQKEGDDFVFVSNLLRDWWKAHFGYAYIPTSERKG